MKNAIREFLDLNEQEKQDLWNKATFVFDTNVYLNLYRYSKETRDTLLLAMKERSDRIWMPYQVAWEYMRKRPEVIADSQTRYSELEKEVLSSCKNKLRIKETDPEFLKFEGFVKEWISSSKAKNLLVESASDDKILSTILELYDGKVGSPYPEERSKEIRSEGANRYSKGIPPGYKDGSKVKKDGDNDNNAYGDLFVWKQILDYALQEKKSIIFVTHDQKEDWWQVLHGKTLGPRIELKKEFYDFAQTDFYMYSMDRFIAQCNADNHVIDEIKSYADVEEDDAYANSFASLGLAVLNHGSYFEVTDIRKYIEELQDKNLRRQSDLEGIYRKYGRGMQPKKVQAMARNLEKNIREDEKKIADLRKQRNRIAHGR